LPPKRRYRLGETRYVQEILNYFYPEAIKISPIRLGRLPEPLGEVEWTPEERAMLTVRMRWADGVAIENGVIHVIEAKLLPGRYPEGLAKLELYRHLIPDTETLAPYLPAQISLELWTPIKDELIQHLAEDKGIKNIVFEPAWFRTFLTSWFPRMRRQPRTE